MGRPKLLFVNRFFYPDQTATSQLLTDVSCELAERGWNVHVITSNRQQAEPSSRLPARERHKGVKVYRLWSLNAGRGGSLAGRICDYLCFYIGALFALLRLCRRGDIIVVKTDPPLISLVAIAATRLRGARMVNWLQDLYPEVAVELGIRTLGGQLGRMLITLRNKALQAAVANVAIGRRMAERVSAAGTPSETIIVIPNWSNEETIIPMETSESKSRRLWGLSNETFVLGYSGNLGRAHEWQTLFEAAHLLRDRTQIRFLFVGGGHESRKLKKAVDEAGMTNFVFQDHQPQEQLSDSLAAADAHWLSLRPELEGLIVPSKFYGIAAAGRPVIAVTSLTGELAEVVRTAGCGRVVAPGDAAGLAEVIRRLAEDVEGRRKMGNRARTLIAEEYARHLALDRWERLIARLAGEISGAKRGAVFGNVRPSLDESAVAPAPRHVD
jgi:colanic acid biosynthesis glycosyl transferase WcaI